MCYFSLISSRLSRDYRTSIVAPAYAMPIRLLTWQTPCDLASSRIVYQHIRVLTLTIVTSILELPGASPHVFYWVLFYSFVPCLTFFSTCSLSLSFMDAGTAWVVGDCGMDWTLLR